MSETTDNLPAADGGRHPCEEMAAALEKAKVALNGLLPLTEKLFNNTVYAARERGILLQPPWVTFDDLKFVKLAREALGVIADLSLQAGRLPGAAGNE